jgi:hypothetical protein
MGISMKNIITRELIRDRGRRFSMRVQDRFRFLLFIMVAFLLVTLSGCSSQSDKEEMSRVKEETSEAVEAAGNYIDEQREEAVRELRDTYDDVSDQIREFREENEGKLNEAQKELMSDLRARQDLIEEKLQQAKVEGRESWEDLKADISASVDDLEEAFADIKARFQE